VKTQRIAHGGDGAKAQKRTETRVGDPFLKVYFGVLTSEVARSLQGQFKSEPLAAEQTLKKLLKLSGS